MDLRWPILLIPIAAAIGIAVWLARRESRRGWQGELPLLARAFRLTELPEYRRALRLHQRLTAAALVLAIVAVTALLAATVRPTRVYEPRPAGSDTPYVDIMLCFGPLFSLQFADGLGLVPLMTDLREKVDGFGNQRIGMTNEYYRVFPVTADHPWVSQRMGEITDLATSYIDSEDFTTRYQLDTALFERQSYSSLARPNVVDTLAMCAMGLPAAGADNGRGKMIVFIGDTRLNDDPGRGNGGSLDPRMYSKTTLEKTIKAAGIQVNAIVPDPITGPIGFVEQLISDTGGQQLLYTEVGGLTARGPVPPKHVENQKAELAGAVDKIFSHPPQAALDEARRQAMQPFDWDVPDLLLQIALVAVIGVAACRLGMRL